MELLTINKLRKEVAGRLLWEISSLHVQTSQKIGLVGENGAGKSTFFKVLLGEERDFSGHFSLSSDWTYVPQIKEEQALSGGEQTLQALKQAFAQKTSLLLLDEPSANLDRENRQWLVHQLRRYRGSLLLISHDRTLLDQVVESIWHVENQRLHVYAGNYSDFLEQRQEDRRSQMAHYQEAQREIGRLEKTKRAKAEKAQKMTKKKRGVSASDWKVNSRLGSYDGKAKAMAKGAKNLEKQINKLGEIKQVQKESWVKLEARGNLDKNLHRLLRLKEGECRIGEKVLFHYDEFSLAFGQKIALLGRNGSGKTTFVEQVIRRSLDGYYSDRLKIAYFSQNLHLLDEERTAFENAQATSQQDKHTILNLMAMLGLPYQKAFQKVQTLSGGERVRLQLAKVLLSDSNPLILDEPTNFLDLVSLEALESFIQDYPGTILFISHDDTFVEKGAEKIYQIADGELQKNLLG